MIDTTVFDPASVTSQAKSALRAAWDIDTVVYCSVILPWRCSTICHRPSSTMRSSETSATIHSSGGLVRYTRLPVTGFLT
ncbi:MAG: hypothetical protein OXF79_17305 [Chloroflexi bacterium]|nr:hypothetical protein [Chloroflexota bacterium]